MDKTCDDCEFYDECPADDSTCLRIKRGLEPLELDANHMRVKEEDDRG